MVTSDGDVLVSRNGGLSAIAAARCPVPRRPAEQDAASPVPALASAGSEPGTGDDPFPELASPAASNMAPGLAPVIASDIDEPGETQPPASPGRSACGLPQPPAQIAWNRDALYVACTAGPVYRWREDTGSWPVQLASRHERDPALPRPQAVPDRIVALLGGDELQLVDASRQLWLLEDDERELRHAGAVPEPVAALAEWQGALIAAGASAVWRRPAAADSWEPLVTVRACALSADRDALWLAGPAGLVELTGPQVRVHAVVPLTGVAIREGDVWLASGRGPVVRAPLAAANAMLTAAPRLTPAGDSAIDSVGVTAGAMDGQSLRAALARARRARWLPELTARARWSRSLDSPASTSGAPWPEPRPGSHAGGLTLFVWLTWRLDSGDSTATVATGSLP
ncbi:MAG TPA: hypothetical protein VNM90_03915 [Haliangium sp.]|nr:hypothetical protein [Haliangium sp.]